MPEGPEIRRMVDDIGKAVAGKTAEQVFFAFDHFKPFEAMLAGRQVTEVAARGKAVLIFFAATDEDGPWCVYSHNQLYGKWRIGRPSVVPRTRRQLRFAIIAPKKTARLYSASDIRLVRPDELHEVDYLARLGPDPLNQNVSVDHLMAVFDDKRFRGRNLGGLLLDQASSPAWAITCAPRFCSKRDWLRKTVPGILMPTVGLGWPKPCSN